MSDDSIGGFDFDPIYEADGEDLGGWMGLLFDGHLDDETATTLTWAYMEDYGYGSSLAAPERCWVRKVPQDGFMTYVYTSGPGRGAQACTRVEEAHGWGFWCDAPRCENRFVRGSAQAGVPRVNISNADQLGSQEQRRPGEYVYLCRRHHRAYDEDLRAAQKAAMDRYYAERVAS